MLQDSKLYDKASSSFFSFSARDAQPKAKVQAGASSGPSDSLYGGLAIILAGQTSVSTLKGDLRVEETGRMEYVPYFYNMASVQSAQYDYTFVTGGSLKLWFRDANTGSSSHADAVAAAREARHDL